MDNCHGCKWLDEVKKKGCGYCCKVRTLPEYLPGMQIRYDYKARCQLYSPGDFKTRYKEGKQ